MSMRERTFRSEKGAVFVQVGISIFVLMAFNVFVLDYGVMWVGRRQAQNAADAGALAAATALAYDDFASPPSSSGVAARSAQQVAARNLVWQEAATTRVLFECPAGVTGNCVRVNVFRNGQNGSDPLPTLFGPIFGITSQGVLATASAIVSNCNATNCLRPIALADNWNEANPPQTPASTFRHYSEPGGVPLATNPDTYVAPSATQAGNTLYSVDLGERRIWDVVSPPMTAPISDGLVLELDFGGGATGFFGNLTTCPGRIVELGQTLPLFPARIVGPQMAQNALLDLMAQDPGVLWNEGDSRIDNSCAPVCAAISPRLIPIALYDPDRFQLGRATNNWAQPAVGCPSNAPCITVTNIVGFFVHGPAGPYGPHGHLLKYPGMFSSTAPSYVDDASWLVSTHLIR